MKDGFRVIDADRHIIEPSDLWDRYMEPEFRGRVQITGPGQAGRFVDGKPVSDAVLLPRNDRGSNVIFAGSPNYDRAFGDALRSGFDPASNMRDMDREGVDVAILFPTQGFYIMWADFIEPKLAAAIARAWNNWMAEYCAFNQERLKGVMLIPLQDPKLAVEELKRGANELGLVGIFWRPNVLCGRTLASEDYFPIYETAQELGIPICVHEGARTILPQAGSDRYSGFGRHVACHPLEQMLACLNLCGDGVLERFPGLRAGHMESGAGWAPFWLERMDEHWEHYSHGRQAVTKEKPSFYFKRQCVISGEAGEELLGVVAKHVGDHVIVMATDYPHPDAADKFPDRTVGDLTRNPELSDELKRKILWDNPARFFGIQAPVAAAAA
jgi:predicted TIM-barrel fold metal-dependent hydrolase